MRLLRVIASVNPATGGPAEGLLRTVAAMDQLGHQTEVATLDAPSASWLANLPIAVHAFGPSTSYYAYSPRLTPWIKKNKGRFDAVIVHGLWNYSSVGTWRALKGGPVPYFVIVHGMLAPWFRTAYQVKHLKKQLFWLAFEGRALRQARCVLFTTEEECRQARGAFWGHSYRERVIAYGTADVGGDPSQQIAAFCTKFTALSGRRFLLSLGRLHPTKGCDILISAFAKVAAFEKDLDLVMAGPDQIGWQIELERLAAEQGISERIHWTGMLTGDAKWGAFRAANAFISASHSESFGISAVEAMACGTPVLITNKFNTWREIQASQGGLVGEDSETGMVTILGDFLARSPNETAKMRIASRHGYLHYFNIENAAASLVRIIEELR